MLIELQRRIVRNLMKLAPHYLRVNLQLIRCGQAETDIETRRSYAEEGEIGAGSFRGYFRIPVDDCMRGKAILDLGSGSGGRSAYWRKDLRAARVTGIDIFPDEVIGAHKAVSSMGIQVSFVVRFGEAMPFRNAVFDAILSLDVLEHVRYPELVLRECYRLLVRGGAFLAVFPPFYHPIGHHLSFVTNFPWLQFFDTNAVTLAFNDIVDGRGEQAQGYRRGSLMPWERLTWLNGLTVRRFLTLVKCYDWRVEYLDCLPLLGYGVAPHSIVETNTIA